MSYTILGFPRTRAMRVMWMLEELNQPYDINPAMPGSDEAKAVNPSGKVPALLDGDVMIPDSVAICQYLADKHGLCTFTAGSAERAVQDSYTQFCVEEIEGPLWSHAKHSFALPEALRRDGMMDVFEAEFERGLGRFEARIGEGPYVMGETFTVPDILFGHCSVWALMLPKWAISSDRLKAYFKGATSRPAYQRAQARAAAETS